MSKFCVCVCVCACVRVTKGQILVCRQTMNSIKLFDFSSRLTFSAHFADCLLNDYIFDGQTITHDVLFNCKFYCFGSSHFQWKCQYISNCVLTYTHDHMSTLTLSYSHSKKSRGKHIRIHTLNNNSMHSFFSDKNQIHVYIWQHRIKL